MYVLRFDNGKYYVGRTMKTLTVGQQMKVRSLFAELNVAYKATIESVFSTETSVLTVEMMVVKLMASHGIENVRGGGYSEIEFNSGTKRILSHLLKYITPTSTDEEVHQQYIRIKNIHLKMWSVYSKTGLSYNDFMQHYDEYEKNPKFLEFDEQARLTRSKKRELFLDVRYAPQEKKLKA